MVSNQIGVDQRLPGLIERYRKTAFRKPVSSHTRDAFLWLKDRVDLTQPLVLDGGCGTASSTVQLAEAYPDHLVLGVDQSAHRLTRGGWEAPGLVDGNRVLLRAELSDLWRLLAMDGRSVTEVCTACGFGDLSNFIRSFKQHYGIPPSAYRARVPHRP